jgi:hypothetical protein
MLPNDERDGTELTLVDELVYKYPLLTPALAIESNSLPYENRQQSRSRRITV